MDMIEYLEEMLAYNAEIHRITRANEGLYLDLDTCSDRGVVRFYVSAVEAREQP